MIMTLHAYEALTGMVSGSDMDMKHEALFEVLKKERPDLVAKGWCQEGFSAFATALGLLSEREAWQVNTKNSARELRMGVAVFSDEQG
jgi:hypothetical protein